MLEKTIYGGLAGIVISSIGAGTFNGYCNGKGINVEPEVLHLGLKYGPTLAYGALGGVLGNFCSGIGHNDHVAKQFTVVGGITGAAIGATATTIGYYLGNYLGRMN